MANSDSEIQLRSSARTSSGQVRENNEDTVQLWAEDQYVLAVVADGMGGAVAGEEASRIAVEAVQQEMTSPEDAETLPTLNDDLLIEKLCESIRTANLNIVRRAAANPEMRGMGTTITLAMVRSTSAIVALQTQPPKMIPSTTAAISGSPNQMAVVISRALINWGETRTHVTPSGANGSKRGVVMRTIVPGIAVPDGD